MQPAFWRKERESEGGREREREIERDVLQSLSNIVGSKPLSNWPTKVSTLMSWEEGERERGREGEREESPLSPVTLTYQSFAGNSHCSGSPKTSLESEREGVRE